MYLELPHRGNKIQQGRGSKTVKLTVYYCLQFISIGQ